MYDLNTRVRLVAIDAEDHTQVEVLRDDVALREAFAIAAAATDRLTPEDAESVAVSIVALPLGVEWSNLAAEDSYYQYDDDNTADVACFAGPEVGWRDSSTVVWNDGGSRSFVPLD